MATLRRAKPRRGPERQGPSVLQRRYTKTSRKKDSGYPREEKTEGFVSCENGGSQRATHEGWEEDQTEALTRGMGSLW